MTALSSRIGRPRAARGFTLVEILIVVIILGILAAIVIPQFTSASQDARKSAMASELQTLQSQIQLFKLQHHDNPPPLADGTNGWKWMTEYSDDTITDAPATSSSSTYTFGPYLQAAPVNPLTNSNTVSATAGTSVGWIYNSTTGQIDGVNAAGVLSDDGN